MRQLRILVAALIGCLFTIATAQVAGAWTVETSASASCPEGSQSVVVKVSFTNNDHRSMYVSAVDRDTSVYANLGEVKPGQSYVAALRLHLDLSQMPKTFQVGALANRDWNLNSDWQRWNFTPAEAGAPAGGEGK